MRTDGAEVTLGGNAFHASLGGTSPGTRSLEDPTYTDTG